MGCQGSGDPSAGGQRSESTMSCFEGPAGFKRSMELLTLKQDRCSLPIKCVQGRHEEAPSRSLGNLLNVELEPEVGQVGPRPGERGAPRPRPQEGASCDCRGRRSGPARLADALGGVPTPTRLPRKSGSRGESPLFTSCRESLMKSEPRAGPPALGRPHPPPLPLVRPWVPQGPTRDSSKCV